MEIILFVESKPPLDISQAVKGPPMPGQSRSLLHFTNQHNNNIKEEFAPTTNNNVNNNNDVNVKVNIFSTLHYLDYIFLFNQPSLELKYHVYNETKFNMQNIKVESITDDVTSNVAEMVSIRTGMPHEKNSKYAASLPGLFGDHDYYASSDDDGAPTIKRESWSPSLSPTQKSYIDADVPPLGYGKLQ